MRVIIRLGERVDPAAARALARLLFREQADDGEITQQEEPKPGRRVAQPREVGR